MDITAGRAANSPAVAVDPTDGRFMALAHRFDSPDFSCGLRVSGNGGETWSGADPVGRLPRGVEKCYAPEIAFDARGVLHYLFVGLAGAGNEPVGVWLTTSSDAAQTFSPPRRVLGPLNFATRMAIDPKRGRIHLVWLHATSNPGVGAFGPPPNPVMAAHSDDGGRTFSRAVQVSDAARRFVVAPSLALGGDGSVRLAYFDLGDDARDYHNLEGPVWEGRWAVVLATSRDGGSRFGKGQVVDGKVVPADRPILIFTMPPPALAVSKSKVCAAWTDGRFGDPDVLARCSAGTGPWSGLVRLNDDARRSGASQYLARLSAAPSGRIDAIFYDRRLDPRNVGSDLYYTYSTDGGASFQPNVRITQWQSSSRVGPQYEGPSAEGQFEFGSRLGLASRDRDALVAWTDTRSSRMPIPSQDIMFARVVFPSAGGSPWPGPALVGVGAAVAAAGALARRRNRREGAPEGGAPAGDGDGDSGP